MIVLENIIHLEINDINTNEIPITKVIHIIIKKTIKTNKQEIHNNHTHYDKQQKTTLKDPHTLP